MDVSRSLVTKIVDEGKLNEALRSGITPEFLNEDVGAIYNYITRHFTDYKKVPDRTTVLQAFPNFEFARAPEPLEYYIDSIKESYRRSILEDKLSVISDIYARDTKAAEALIRETLSGLSITAKSFKDVDMAASAAERVDYYETRKQNPGADGILSNWAKLDYQTLGWHAEEFIVLVGEKYMGKSWKMLWLAMQAAFQNERVLIATKEMSQEAVVRRMDSIYAGVPFDSLRRGELTYVEEQKYKAKMAELSASNINIMVARQGVTTIEDIELKAVETDATIIFGDSIYLFDPDARSRFNGETSKRLAVSQKCKSVAQNLGIPFVVSVQAGRKKSKERVIDLDSIEWSNAFSQDADTCIFLHKDDLDRELQRAQMHILKSREGDVDQFYINQDFQNMDFSQRDDELSPTTDVFEEDDDIVMLDGED